MKIIGALVVLGSIVALEGCAQQPLAGQWECDTASTTSYTAPAGAPDYDGSGSYEVAITEDANGKLTETRMTGSAGAACPLHATIAADGLSATLGASQTCLNSVGNHVTYQEGSMQLSGQRLTGVRTFTVSGKTASNQPLEGSGTATFVCTRKE